MVNEPEDCDLGILTVVGVELQAMLVAFGAAGQQPEERNHRKYWRAKIYSPNEGRNLDVVVGFCGKPGTVSAALQTVRFLREFSPALLVLAGIAAGDKKAKFKLGDVVIGVKVADLSVGQVENGKTRVRPTIPDLPSDVAQLVRSFSCDEAELGRRALEVLKSLGKPLEQPSDAKALKRFNKTVSRPPRVRDCVIGSGNLLVRDGDKFTEYQTIEPQIRAIEMEAAGMVHALEDMGGQQAWLVVRGISDFGDKKKDKLFDAQPYASVTAAVYVRLFAENGFDRRILMGASRPPLPARSEVARLSGSPPGLAGGTMSVLAVSAATVLQGSRDSLGEELGGLRAEFERVPADHILKKVQALRGKTAWGSAPAETRAQVIRFQAELVLAFREDVVRAEQLSVEADTLARGNRTLRARLHARMYGVQAAVEQLGSPVDLGEWNLRMSLLLQSGQTKSMLDQFENPPEGVGPNAESRRLHAVALVTDRQIGAAETEVALASKRNPDSFLLRFAAALVGYFGALSPAAPPGLYVLSPIPVPLRLVKGDALSLAKLEKAGLEFEALAGIPATPVRLHAELLLWQLACLANHVARQAEATQHCQEVLRSEPGNVLALQWASERHYPIDKAAQIASLATQLNVRL